MYDTAKLKTLVQSQADKVFDELKKAKDAIGENPELGSEEEKSSQILVNLLKNHGFEVEYPFFGMHTAFKAVKKGKEDEKDDGFVNCDGCDIVGGLGRSASGLRNRSGLHTGQFGGWPPGNVVSVAGFATAAAAVGRGSRSRWIARVRVGKSASQQQDDSEVVGSHSRGCRTQDGIVRPVGILHVSCDVASTATPDTARMCG